MSFAARKKRPTGKITVQDLEEESLTLQEQSGPLPTTETTPIQDADPSPEIEQPTQETHANLRTQLEQNVSAALGLPAVQLTDSQFRRLLERLSAESVARGTEPLSPKLKQPAKGGPPEDDPSEDPSDHGSDHGSYRPRRQTPGSPLRHDTPSEGKRSPKHAEPPKLNDGTDPTYTAWRALLRGKLRANADWWPTEQDRIDYVFSCTEGEAQRHLEPRIDEDSAEPWRSVDEMLQHLNTIFRDHFEAERSENAFYALKQSIGQEFSDFYTEFARLASIGRIPSSTWRSHLWRKLNKEFQNRLLATHHQHTTYQDLVRECQRLSVDLEEFDRRFPPTASSQRYRPSTLKVAAGSGSTPPRPRQGLLPAPRYSTAAFKTLPPSDKRDSATPGPRDSPARETDPTKATCFNCREVGHFMSSCPNPRNTPRIHEIKQDAEFFSGDDKANDEADPDDSESEN
jgi:Zinc knuckle